MACTLLNKKLKELVGEKIIGIYDNDIQRSEVFKKLTKKSYPEPKATSITDSNNHQVALSMTCALTRFDNQLGISIALQIIPPEVIELKKLHSVLKNYDKALQAAHVGIWSWSLKTNKISCDKTMHDLFLNLINNIFWN